jgi:TonB family protein
MMNRFLFLVIVFLVLIGSTSFAAPPYPYEARRAHLTGSGIYEAYLRPDRTVAKVVVIKSAGYRVLDDYAIAVFREWRFSKAPPTVNKVRIPLTFNAKGH